MLLTSESNRGKTAVRHGDKDGLIDYLIQRGFKPKVTEVTQSELKNLGRDDLYYGFLTPDSRILLIDMIGTKDKKKMTRYWLIVI